MKTLIAGLGGGLDIINASALYFLAKAAGEDVYLGSIKTKGLDTIVNKEEINSQAALIRKDTVFSKGGRYAEAHVAAHLNDPIFYFAQSDAHGVNAKGLKYALLNVKERFDFDQMIFVDCGGDSLTFRREDAIAHAQTTDPFEGGDAISLEALACIKHTYLAVAAIGLDIDRKAAARNLKHLQILNQYEGSVDLGYAQNVLRIPLWLDKGGLQNYFSLVERIVKIAPDKGFFSSLTAPVLYHAIKGNYGPQYTAAKWAQGNIGYVDVLPEYATMHVVAAHRLHELKCNLNNRPFRKK